MASPARSSQMKGFYSSRVFAFERRFSRLFCYREVFQPCSCFGEAFQPLTTCDMLQHFLEEDVCLVAGALIADGRFPFEPCFCFMTKSKVVVQSTLLTPRPNRFTRALPPRGSRDPLRLAEGVYIYIYISPSSTKALDTARASLLAGAAASPARSSQMKGFHSSRLRAFERRSRPLSCYSLSWKKTRFYSVSC